MAQKFFEDVERVMTIIARATAVAKIIQAHDALGHAKDHMDASAQFVSAMEAATEDTFLAERFPQLYRQAFAKCVATLQFNSMSSQSAMDVIDAATLASLG
eukprot:3510481-Alexandrium_andersonii.AAC.1